MITGYTSHKLDLIKTYSNTNPYQIGVNGVTSLEYDTNNVTAVTKVHYYIDEISYITELTPIINAFGVKEYKTYFISNISGDDFQEAFLIKEEAKMKLISPPKVDSEVFIERNNSAIFERHSRLSEIKTLDSLIDYRNGYYNIK